MAMFNPPPPGPDPSLSRQHEPDHEIVPPIGAWRPLGRWPALLRLSWLCRLLAVLSLIGGAIGVLLGILSFLAAWNPEAPRVSESARLLSLLYIPGAIISAVVGFIFWCGIAEAILLAIALERNTRQTRDRLPKHPIDDYTGQRSS
jgi:hypothetical protein